MSARKQELGDWLSKHTIVEMLVDGRKIVPRSPQAVVTPKEHQQSEVSGTSPLFDDDDTAMSMAVFVRQCRTCGLRFDSVEAHRAHFQSPEHCAKVRQLSGEPTKTDADDGEDEAEDEEDDTVEMEEEVPGRTPHVVFVAEDGEKCTVWRNVAEGLARIDKKLAGDDPSLLLASYTGLNSSGAAAAQKNWAILLCRAGYFAGAVYCGSTVLQHRCFQRYTTRKKQGRAQCNADSESGRSIHSAGSSIRRHNEVRYCELMHETLRAWASLLDPEACSLVLVAAPRNQRAARYLYFEGSPLTKNDPRIRNVPITTSRPTFMQVQAVHDAMWRVAVTEDTK